ncbi:MAG: transcription-repair coupling factor [Clostridia bacterium]|nr:transcription-repair coupling factor [Clostridia bacterium]
MIPEFLKPIHLGEKLAKLDRLGDKRIVDSNLSAISILRVSEGAKAHLAYSISASKLYITSDQLQAKAVTKRLNSYEKDCAVYLPHKDDTLFYRGGTSRIVERERLSALTSYLEGKHKILVVSADGLLQKLSRPELFDKFTSKIHVEDFIAPGALAENLAKAGYTRVDAISEIGDFALRGDILDVYSADGRAYRIDFFDEMIEEIKSINLEEMVSTGTYNSLCIPPNGDLIVDEECAGKLKEKLTALGEKARVNPEGIHEGVLDNEYIWAVPLGEDNFVTVFDMVDYVAEKQGLQSVVIIDEPKPCHEKLNILGKEFGGRLKHLIEDEEVLPCHIDAVISLNEVKRQLLLRRKVSFTALALSNPMFEPKTLIEPRCIPVTKYYLDAGSIFADMREFIKYGYKVLLACGDEEKAKAVTSSLMGGDVYATFSLSGNVPSDSGHGVIVTPLTIENGFCCPDLKVIVVGVSECIGKQRGKEIFAPKQQFIAPKPGDYVVHKVHGVGLCKGTTIMKVGDYEKEYIVIKYRDDGTLYVASDQTDNLQKFVGQEHPRLNKLGGKEFEREKEKVRQSAKKLAVNLLEIYAKREKQEGFRYAEDTVWQKEFEDSFPYEETPDQLKAIADIKRDMEIGRIMDRLLVGDVGFGKTEVAFRAMFKTVLDGKQAVLIAPTTILARQHYENLKPRLEEFGIDVALLTRLQTNAENTETLKRLSEGTLHMVVATHKVLGEKVQFHDLGLLVLDEEQRFGVNHKEKLKGKYPKMNVLTLSATPIPRTLNMALTGIRDISVLETAPVGRLPVQTYVTPYSDTLVKDAIVRECARQGQTLILLNDIDGLDIYASHLRTMLGDDIRIVTAHGQMQPNELEKRMSAFYDKQYDVLISTTIIENGIDLPDANTLIVLNAGHFGLSQLYQLRGRVGRRGALAHAYFTLPENGTLTEDADKRLQALLDNTEIGSGFKVALSDLSIRGAGNILGAEQHGHIEKVGYEMYIQLLNEAVEELRTGVPHKELREVEMKIDAGAYIHEGYVSGRDKMRIYKRIAGVSTPSQRDELVKELTDVFGPCPKPLKNLINISLLKNMARGYEVTKITVNKLGAGVVFEDSSVFKNEGIMRAVSVFSSEAVLTSTIPPNLVFNIAPLSPEEKIDKLIDFFVTAGD